MSIEIGRAADEAVIKSLRARIAQHAAEIEKLRAALQGYLDAEPQCICGEHSGCGMGAARAVARRALELPDTPHREINHE